MRWGLSEGTRVEVWRGTQLLGTLSGETLRQLVAQHLSTVALVTAMQTTLAGSDPDVAALPPRLPPRPLPSKDILTREGKGARRQARVGLAGGGDEAQVGGAAGPAGDQPAEPRREARGRRHLSE